MNTTPQDGVPAAALAEPDWHSLEDELAPICDELAARYAALYDTGRRRTEYLARLETIRERDERGRVEHEAAMQAAAQAAVVAAVRATGIEAGLAESKSEASKPQVLKSEVLKSDESTDAGASSWVPTLENAVHAPTPVLLPAWS